MTLSSFDDENVELNPKFSELRTLQNFERSNLPNFEFVTQNRTSNQVRKGSPKFMTNLIFPSKTETPKNPELRTVNSTQHQMRVPLLTNMFV